jgi:hypothetical protein
MAAIIWDEIFDADEGRVRVFIGHADFSHDEMDEDEESEGLLWLSSEVLEGTW